MTHKQLKVTLKTYNRLKRFRRFLESKPVGERTATLAGLHYVLNARVTYDDAIRILLDNVKVGA